MIIVAVAALIGGRLYHVIDQWALYKDDPIKIFLPPYSGLGVYGGIITGTIAAFLYARYKHVPFLRWADIIAPGLFVDAGDRPLGQLLQPGAVRPADDAAVGHPDRLRPPDRGATFDYPCAVLPGDDAASTRCSCTSRCPGVARRRRPASGSATTLRKRLRPGRPAARLLHLVRRRPVRPRDVPRRATGRSSASRPRRSCRSCSSIPALVILAWRHRPGHPTRRPADASGGRDVGRHRTAGRAATARDDRCEPRPTSADDASPTTIEDAEARRRRRRTRARARTGDRRPTDMTEPPTPGRAEARADRRAVGCRPRRSPRPAAAPSRASPGSVVRPRRRRRSSTGSCGWSPGSSSSCVFRFRIRTSGQEHLPPGGYLLVGAAHRGWMDPFVVMHAHPGRAARLVPRQRAVDVHVALARAAHPPARRPAAGLARRGRDRRSTSPRRGRSSPTAAVFVQMPEGTVSGPPGRIGPFRTGWAVIALRTDAPIVPLAIAGTEELYIGRRMASRVLPATTARALAGLEPGAPSCRRGDRARSSTLAHRMSDALRGDPRSGGRGAPPVDGRSARPPAAAPQAPDLAAPASPAASIGDG